MILLAVLASQTFCLITAIISITATTNTVALPWYLRANGVAAVLIVVCNVLGYTFPEQTVGVLWVLTAIFVALTTMLTAQITTNWRGQFADDITVSIGILLVFWCLITAITGQPPSPLSSTLTVVTCGILWGARSAARVSKAFRGLPRNPHISLCGSAASQSVAWLLLSAYPTFGDDWLRLGAAAGFIANGVCMAVFFWSRLSTSERMKPPPRSDPSPGVFTQVFAAFGGVCFLLTLSIAPQTLNPLMLAMAGVGLVSVVARSAITLQDYSMLADQARNQEEYYRSLVQDSGDVIVICDPETGITSFVSPAAEHVLGSTGELINQPLSTIMGASPEQTHQMLHRVKTGGSTERLEGSAHGRTLEAVASPRGDHALVTIRDVSEREALRKELHHLAYFDPLTGLANRHSVFKHIRDSLQHVEHHTSVLFIDIDRFKQVNDASGHEAGDRVLIEVADRLQQIVGDSGFLGRVGGDEFVAVVDRQHSNPEALAQRVATEMAVPFHAHGKTFQLGASVGIANPTGPSAPSEVLRQADVAMYSAKRHRELFVNYEPTMTSSTIAEVDSDASVAAALRQGNLELHFQPIVDLRSDAVHCVEALLRWRDDYSHLHPPAQLLEFARRTGKMPNLTSWVIENALQHMQHSDSSVSLSVNLPPQDLLNPHFTQDLAGQLADSRFDPQRLLLEITEDATIGQAQESTKVLDTLRDLGVRVLIDDFGSGFSSLGYLIDLPLDGLKIDRQFITALPTHSSARSILRNLVSLASDNNLTLVAEGVQSESEDQWVRQLGSPAVQGFYYARPLEASLCGDLTKLSVWEDHHQRITGLPPRRQNIHT